MASHKHANFISDNFLSVVIKSMFNPVKGGGGFDMPGVHGDLNRFNKFRIKATYDKSSTDVLKSITCLRYQSVPARMETGLGIEPILSLSALQWTHETDARRSRRREENTSAALKSS